jgi:hypothetical protein
MCQETILQVTHINIEKQMKHDQDEILQVAYTIILQCPGKSSINNPENHLMVKIEMLRLKCWEAILLTKHELQDLLLSFPPY